MIQVFLTYLRPIYTEKLCILFLIRTPEVGPILLWTHPWKLQKDDSKTRANGYMGSAYRKCGVQVDCVIAMSRLTPDTQTLTIVELCRLLHYALSCLLVAWPTCFE